MSLDVVRSCNYTSVMAVGCSTSPSLPRLERRTWDMPLLVSTWLLAPFRGRRVLGGYIGGF